MNSIANVTLSSVKQVQAEEKYSCPVWFGLLHLHLLLDTQGIFAVLGGGDSTKVPGTDPSFGSQSAVNLIMFLSLQALPLRDPLNTRLTFYQNLHHLLRGSIEYYLLNLLRSEHCCMTSSARAGSGPAFLLIWPPLFFLRRRMEP